jgi:POLQ-like helicase
MNPESQSYALLGMTRSKAKMFEYGVAERFHIQPSKTPSQLFALCIGIIGDYGRDNISEENGLTQVNGEKLLFAAQFFDSIIASRLNAEYENYFLLVGAAAYYLVDSPGSADVLVKQINEDFEFECEGLDLLLLWLLRNDSSSVDFGKLIFSESCRQLYVAITQFLDGVNNESAIVEQLDSMCSYIYQKGTDRQLLFADLIRSICKKRLYNSTRNSLQRYSSVDIREWEDIILKPSFIKEFWPAQKLLGEKRIFDGQSGIIQMPTSSGKTKSIELIIRSSFLSERSDLAVIIAPFRALCSEIKSSLQTAFKFETVIVDDPSDTIQPDFDYDGVTDQETIKRVLILTPEKFIYILRTMPEISDTIGLLIYDEGHQFDNGIRGVTYELLLSSLKNKVPITAQIVLISAVISNAEAIGNWLIDKDKEIIADKNLLPTYRTIAFANWTTALGQLKFVKGSDPDQDEYFVPRVLESQLLDKKGKERSIKNFPEKNDANDISLFLGLKLVSNGSVAIFCGSKVTVRSLCNRLLDIASRNYDVTNPLKNSEQEEVSKLSHLHEIHFGPSNIFSACANFGIFSHSANTPEGLRLAIEYAATYS